MITLATTYYNNPKMLQKQFEYWGKYSADVQKNVMIIVIDDGSKEYPAIDVFRDNLETHESLYIELYKIKQDILWNIEGARNLAFNVVQDGWVFYTDIDHVVPSESIEKLLTEKLNDKCYYSPVRYKMLKKGVDDIRRHGDTFIITKDMFWRTGGFDEDFAGWYGGSTRVFTRYLNKIADRIELDEVYHIFFDKTLISDSYTNNNRRRNSKYDFMNSPELVRKSFKSAGKYKPNNPIRFEWERVF